MTKMDFNDFCELMDFENVIIMDDYEDALIGVSFDGRAVYDYELMVNCLVERDDCTPEDAIEWIEYNTLRAIEYIDENHRPIIIYPYNLQLED